MTQNDFWVTNFYNNGLRTNLSLAQPTGSWTNGFGYDAAKRLTSVTSPAGAFGYTYVNGASRLTQKLALPNTSYITNAYDTVARLRFTKLNNSGNTTLDKAEYGYNAGNQRTTMTNSVNWSTNRYDKIGQLTVVDRKRVSPEYLHNSREHAIKDRTSDGFPGKAFSRDSRFELRVLG